MTYYIITDIPHSYWYQSTNSYFPMPCKYPIMKSKNENLLTIFNEDCSPITKKERFVIRILFLRRADSYAINHKPLLSKAFRKQCF